MTDRALSGSRGAPGSRRHRLEMSLRRRPRARGALIAMDGVIAFNAFGGAWHATARAPDVHPRARIITQPISQIAAGVDSRPVRSSARWPASSCSGDRGAMLDRPAGIGGDLHASGPIVRRPDRSCVAGALPPRHHRPTRSSHGYTARCCTVTERAQVA